MFEFHLRILDVRERETDPPSFLGIVEGFPQIMTHSASVEQAERDLRNALAEYLRGIQNHEATHIEWDDYPTVQLRRLYLGSRPD
jgi:predicted RNase H-like HicB family nuclease